MARLTSTRCKTNQATTLWVTLLPPRVAWGGWGEENWGEMIWGAALPPVPSLSVLGQVALAVLLLALPARLLLRRRRQVRP